MSATGTGNSNSGSMTKAQVNTLRTAKAIATSVPQHKGATRINVGLKESEAIKLQTPQNLRFPVSSLRTHGNALAKNNANFVKKAKSILNIDVIEQGQEASPRPKNANMKTETSKMMNESSKEQKKFKLNLVGSQASDSVLDHLKLLALPGTHNLAPVTNMRQESKRDEQRSKIIVQKMETQRRRFKSQSIDNIETQEKTEEG